MENTSFLDYSVFFILVGDRKIIYIVSFIFDLEFYFVLTLKNFYYNYLINVLYFLSCSLTSHLYESLNYLVSTIN